MENKIESVIEKLLEKISTKIDGESSALDLHTYASILTMLKPLPDFNGAMKSMFDAIGRANEKKENKDAQN